MPGDLTSRTNAGRDITLIQPQRQASRSKILSGAFARSSVLSMNTDEAHRRAEALFKKEQQSHEAQQAMTEYKAELQAMREKTARLRALRLARDAVNQKMRTAR